MTIKNKIYIIKQNEKLYNEWMRCVTSVQTKVGLDGAWIVQNNGELTTDQLNDWYKDIGNKIKETEVHFARKLQELENLRQQTVDYIKRTNT